jgi:putative transposase
MREADERLAEYSFSAEQHDYTASTKAFQAFFRRIRRWQKRGFTRCRAKSRFHSAEIRVRHSLTIRDKRRVRIVGIAGEIKVRLAPTFPAES